MVTPEQAADLEVARALIRIGVPMFLGRPDATRPTGFAEPLGWQRQPPDESVVDAWQPGWALCAVMGHALDLIDLDPRAGGELPVVGPLSILGRADTPSGGQHLFVAPLGVRSRDGIWPGVDLKSGLPDVAEQEGRGYAFLAPTVRASKVDGVQRAYRWAKVPLTGSVRDAAHVARTQGVSGGLAEVRQRVLDLRQPADNAQAGSRRLARSAAAAEWGRACERLTEQVRHWAVTGWGGDAHAGLLEAAKHLVMLAPDHAEAGYLSAFRQAGVEPDEGDLAKLASALEKYSGQADQVIPDEQLSRGESFWVGGMPPGPPPFGVDQGIDAKINNPPAVAPPGTFDFVTVERVRDRQAPPPPTLGAFGGTKPLFYEEGVHWLQGESESGKSWVALAIVTEVLHLGGTVLVIDYEDTEGPVLERLEQLGVTDEEFGRLVYVAAVDVPHGALVDHVATSGRDYTMVLVDGVTSALTAAGLSGRDEQELTAWVNMLPRRARMAVCVDHVVKAVDERRGMAIGTQAKKSVVTGASYEVTCTEKFGRGSTGELILHPQKDKRGGVRALIGDRPQRLRFSSDAGTGAVTITVPSAAPRDADGRTEDERLAPEAHALYEVLVALEQDGKARAGHSQKHLVQLLGEHGHSTWDKVARPAVKLFWKLRGNDAAVVPDWLWAHHTASSVDIRSAGKRAAQDPQQGSASAASLAVDLVQQGTARVNGRAATNPFDVERSTE